MTGWICLLERKSLPHQLLGRICLGGGAIQEGDHDGWFSAVWDGDARTPSWPTNSVGVWSRPCNTRSSGIKVLSWFGCQQMVGEISFTCRTRLCRLSCRQDRIRYIQIRLGLIVHILLRSTVPIRCGILMQDIRWALHRRQNALIDIHSRA